MSEIKIEDIDLLVRAAAGWWTQKVCLKHTHRNGDDSDASIMACIMADMMEKPVSVGQAIGFSNALAEEIGGMQETGGQTQFLSCDYGADIHLANAAEKASIPVFNFPFKTNMKIDFGAKKIFVSDGYGVPYKEIKLETPEFRNCQHHGNNNTQR